MEKDIPPICEGYDYKAHGSTRLQHSYVDKRVVFEESLTHTKACSGGKEKASFLSLLDCGFILGGLEIAQLGRIHHHEKMAFNAKNCYTRLQQDSNKYSQNTAFEREGSLLQLRKGIIPTPREIEAFTSYSSCTTGMRETRQECKVKTRVTSAGFEWAYIAGQLAEEQEALYRGSLDTIPEPNGAVQFRIIRTYFSHSTK